MILLADEGVDKPIVDRLRQDGHTVLYIAELDPSIDDEAVLRRANQNGALLVTADKDFGEFVFRMGQIHAGGYCSNGRRIHRGIGSLNIDLSFLTPVHMLP